MPFGSHLAANRRNSKLSTGPVSPAGKLAVRSNALKHGFYSHSAVLESQESQSEFETLQRDFFGHIAPVGPIELELAARLVLSVWQLRRLQTIESQSFQFPLIDARESISKSYKDCDDLILGYAFRIDIQREASLLESVARHRVRWERTYYRALHELERLQLSRRGHAVPPPQVVEIHDSCDCPLPTPVLPPPSSPATPAPPPPSAPPGPADGPAKPTLSDSPQKTKPPNGFVSQKKKNGPLAPPNPSAHD